MPSAEKLATMSSRPTELAIKKPKSISDQIFSVLSMAPINTINMLRKATRPKNLPTTISVSDSGALNRNGKVWLRRSSEIKRMESNGTANSIMNEARP